MIRVSKIALTKTLKRVVSFIPRVKTSDTAGVVTLKPTDNGVKLILSYPEAGMEAFCPTPEAPEQEDDLAISGNRLLSIASLADVEVRIQEVDGSIEVVSGSSKWTEPMPTVRRKSITPPTTDPITFDVYPVLTAFNTVRYAVQSDSIRPSLFMIDVKDGKVRACNGVQYHEVDTTIDGLTFSISGGMVDNFIAVLRHFDGEVEFYDTDDSIYFRNGEDTIGIKKLQVNFPDLDRLLVRPLRSEAPALLQIDKKQLSEALRKVRLSIDEKKPYVEVHLTQKEALLRVTQANGAEAVSKLPAVWDTKPRIVTFHAKYLARTLDSLPEGTLELRFGTDTKKQKSPLVIEGVGSWAMLNQAKIKARA